MQNMRTPKISMIVAKNGAAECAGSMLQRSRASGMSVPTIIEVITMHRSERLMATALHRSPWVKYTLQNPIATSRLASTNEMRNSLKRTLDVSLSDISPVESPRMTSVAD